MDHLDPPTARLVDARLGRWGRFGSLVGRAARERGITLVELADAHREHLLCLRRGEQAAIIHGARSPWLTAVARRLSDDRYISGELLRSAGLPVIPRIATKSSEQLADVAPTLLDTWGRCVAKPCRGRRGVGVVPGLVSVDEIEGARRVAAAVDPDGIAILEPEMSQEDVRLCVVGGAVVAAVRVTRPAAVGDGRSRPADLLRRIDKDPRRAEPEALTPLCHIEPPLYWDGVLAVYGLTPELRAARNLRIPLPFAFTEIEDITATIHGHWRELALAATQRLGVDVAAVELMVANPKNPDQGHVIEVRTDPPLDLFELTTVGPGQPVAGAFVDWCMQA